MFENGVLRKICGPMWGEVTGDWGRICIKRSFVICTVHRILRGSQMEDDGIRRAGQVTHTECWHGNEKERDHLEDVVLDERIRLKWIWKKWVGKTWSALEYEQVARCCQPGYGTAWITWLAEELLASEEGVYSEVSWIVTNKFHHNERRSYRGNIVTGLPLQEWLTRPYDILEHHQPHHIPDLQDSPLHTLDYSSKFIPRHITLSPNVLC